MTRKSKLPSKGQNELPQKGKISSQKEGRKSVELGQEADDSAELLNLLKQAKEESPAVKSPSTVEFPKRRSVVGNARKN